MSSRSAIVIDLDGTITIPSPGTEYKDLLPNNDVVQRMREYRESGFRIVIHTARNMRTHAGQIGVINVDTLPKILSWLHRHDIPYDEVIVGKPWCGPQGFYVDDRAIRPDEFLTMSIEEASVLTGENLDTQ